MLIRQAHLQGIAAGRVSLAFRRWKVARVKPGSKLKTGIGELLIERVDVVAASDITESMAGQAGFDSRAALMAELALRPEGDIHRIHLRLHGPDPRWALREQSALTADELDALRARLARMDQRAPGGPWTLKTLETIDRMPERRAAELAGHLGVEKEWLKTHIRQLKNLGLTESLETGYRLSPRGRSVLALPLAPIDARRIASK